MAGAADLMRPPLSDSNNPSLSDSMIPLVAAVVLSVGAFAGFLLWAGLEGMSHGNTYTQLDVMYYGVVTAVAGASALFAKSGRAARRWPLRRRWWEFTSYTLGVVAAVFVVWLVWLRIEFG